jgi:hypothetical protein
LPHALFVCPKGATLAGFESEIISEGLTVSIEVARNWKAVLGVSSVPPGLASANSGLPALVCGVTVFIRLATSTHFLGFRWNSTNIIFVVPTKNTKLWHNCGHPHF